MKKYVVVAVFVLACLWATALADVDLSGMSYEELVELEKQVEQAIWASDGWQEVTVPPGTYKIGEDIPVGKWLIKPVDGARVDFYYCAEVDEAGSASTSSAYKYENLFSPSFVSMFEKNPAHEITVDCVAGMYITLENGSVTFSPAVKTSLGFK